MVTGSLASSYHGEPRATRDVDIVIDPTADGLARFVGAMIGLTSTSTRTWHARPWHSARSSTPSDRTRRKWI